MASSKVTRPRSRTRDLVRLLLAIAIAAVAITAIAFALNAFQVDSEAATVEKIVDGDTIDVRRDGETVRVRLLNIDTPEQGECLFDESVQRLSELIPQGSPVRLEYDVERQDRYGRDLAGVYVDTPDGHVFVNEQMVREGLARAVEYQPNTRYSQAMTAAAAEANRARLGIHGVPPACLLPTDVGKQALERYVRDPDPFYKAVMRDAVERTPNFTYREPALAFIDSL